jgi:hypothetical protein
MSVMRRCELGQRRHTWPGMRRVPNGSGWTKCVTWAGFVGTPHHWARGTSGGPPRLTGIKA